MYLEAGKQIEKLLVGEVLHPIPTNRETVRSEVSKFRERYGRNFEQKMDVVRMDQKESNPSNPKALFAKNLLSDLDEAMGNISDMADGRYELRLYSSLNTVLDHDHKFDFWVELTDTLTNKTIANYRIDLTIDPEKYFPAGDADIVYYFNDKYHDDEKRGHMDIAYREDKEYQKLIREASGKLLDRSKAVFSLVA
jgi:hypothetical protein